MPRRRCLAVIAVILSCFVVSWAATREKTLYNFNGGADGSYPLEYGNLLLDGKGNLYGTTAEGGTLDPPCSGTCGTVFELSPSQGGWVKTTLYEFVGGLTDGSNPYSGLVPDGSGNLYGTTYSDGSIWNCGTVYELSPNSDGTWTETVLHSFGGSRNNNDGCQPVSGVVVDNSGNIYGTTVAGGSGGFGTVFELSNSGGTWNETVLHDFSYGTSDGQDPYGTLALDSEGNLYGTTLYGGAYAFGTVFELTQSAGVWTENVLYNFEYNDFGTHDGAYPYSGVTLGSNGNLYGSTNYGGTGTACSPGSCGAVYMLKHSTSGWTESVLYSFKGGTDGSLPNSGITLAAGKLYGTTSFGGGGTCQAGLLNGCGTVFQLEQSNGKWVESVFRFNVTNGAYANSGVTILKGKSVLFGTTLDGGNGPCTASVTGCGVVYAIGTD